MGRDHSIGPDVFVSRNNVDVRIHHLYVGLSHYLDTMSDRLSHWDWDRRGMPTLGVDEADTTDKTHRPGWMILVTVRANEVVHAHRSDIGPLCKP